MGGGDGCWWWPCDEDDDGDESWQERLERKMRWTAAKPAEHRQAITEPAVSNTLITCEIHVNDVTIQKIRMIFLYDDII